MTNQQIVEKILQHEGGFVNDPNDKGGATKFGITLDTLSDWKHKEVTTADIQALTKDEAVQIYLSKYIYGPGFDTIPDDKVRYLVVDMWVHHGPRRATLIIQKSLGLPGDGILGPKTLSYLRSFDISIFSKVLSNRMRFYGTLITKDPTQAKFAAGWLDRCADFIYEN